MVALSFITARMLLDIAATGRQGFQIASECRKQRFASLADVVHELEEPQVDRELLL